MVNQLLIELEILPPKKYLQFINMYKEIVRGIPIHIIYKITNISDQNFLGGILKEIKLNTPDDSFKTYYYPNMSIHELKPNESMTVYDWEITVIWEGTTWVTCIVEPTDKQPVEYYQIREKIGKMQGEWKNAYSIVNHEQLDILLALEEITKKLSIKTKK